MNTSINLIITTMVINFEVVQETVVRNYYKISNAFRIRSILFKSSRPITWVQTYNKKRGDSPPLPTPLRLQSWAYSYIPTVVIHNIYHNLNFPVRFVTSNKGNQQLQYGGFTFYRHSQSRAKTRWACSTHYFKGCRARIFTHGTQAVAVKNEHNHPKPGLTRISPGELSRMFNNKYVWSLNMLVRWIRALYVILYVNCWFDTIIN